MPRQQGGGGRRARKIASSRLSRVSLIKNQYIHMLALPWRRESSVAELAD